MSEASAAPASLREALGEDDEGLVDRVSAVRRNKGDVVHRARRLIETEEQPSDDELAIVLTGFMLRRR